MTKGEVRSQERVRKREIYMGGSQLIVRKRGKAAEVRKMSETDNGKKRMRETEKNEGQQQGQAYPFSM